MTSSNYFSFATANRRFISFGFFAAFTSSFGQTYFIGIFGPAFQTEFGLSHTAWGSIYLIGTLGSAAALTFTGKFIDHMPLRHYTLLVLALLIIACGSTAFVAGTLSLVGVVFLLRHAGQGLMSHIAVTTMARYFHAGRGKAIAIATLGYSAGEALLPFMAVLAIGLLGWRWTWGGVALILTMLMITIPFILPKDFGRQTQDHKDPGTHPGERKFQHSWTRSEALRDVRIYLLLPGLLAPGIILTAMFFHHLTLAEAKGWSYTWITGSYIIYAGATIMTSLLVGQLIDRLGAVRLVPFMLVPLVLAMLVVALFNNPFAVLFYMVLLGICVGIAHTSVSAMWAEIYGVVHLGAIRSLMAAVGVFGTALGPVTMGTLMDRGLSIEQVCLLFATYTVLGLGLMVVAFRRKTEGAGGS